ncbi:hypothetical protein K0U27_11250 [archaeon]|nr:hypothetical protein [archaeon]
MNRKPMHIAGIVALFAVGTITASYAITEVTGESAEKPAVPRYSETCSHGHNGFDCKTPKYKMDIFELQKRTDDLEKRVSQLERPR